MLLIVAHHYVVNSDVLNLMYNNPLSANSIYMFILGAWGKIGINCFIFITGYFMCKKNISLTKFIKLLLEVLFYNLFFSIFFIFVGIGNFSDFFKSFLIIKNIDSSNFTACFLLFYLFIPFLNVLIQNINQRQHKFLIGMLSFLYIFLGTIPKFSVTMNYVSWFSFLFLVSSYIRLYNIKKKNWGILTLLFFVLSVVSIILCLFIGQKIQKNIAYRFVTDSNTFLAFAVSFCSFMYFIDLKIKTNKIINLVAGSTFGILLIHTNSDAMRNWLWKDIFRVQIVYDYPFYQLIFYSFISIFTVFIVCALIDILRKRFLEKKFLEFIYNLEIYKKIDIWFKKIEL